MGFSLTPSSAKMFLGSKIIADTSENMGRLQIQGRPVDDARKTFPRERDGSKRLFLGGFLPNDKGMHGWMGHMLDVRMYDTAFNDAETFFVAGGKRVDQLEETLRGSVKTHVQFGTVGDSREVTDRISGKIGVYKAVAMGAEKKGVAMIRFR